MHTVTFISTIHKEIGKCNSNELCKIFEELEPDVIFLEAAEDTYSGYERYLFSEFGVYHKKLEIAAIQKYSQINSFNYVPVCGIYLSEAYHNKMKIVTQNINEQKLIDRFNSLASHFGFDFLNSIECINLQEELRLLESQILIGTNLDELAKADIDAYEGLMIKNIFNYCKTNSFNSSIFMCGAAHRKSIIEKVEKSQMQEEIALNWINFGK